jgi:hypothetical protein
MSFSFAIFLVGVLDRDFLVHEVLAVHVGYGVVRGFEVGEGDEAIAFGEIAIVSRNLSKSMGQPGALADRL